MITEEEKLGIFEPPPRKITSILRVEDIMDELERECEEKERQAKLDKKKKLKQKTQTPELQPFEFKNPNINTHDYVQIPQFKKAISTYELAGFNNMNWENTHFKLHEKGLYMPVVNEFMTHFNNVVNSHKNKTPLFDAKGNTFTKKEIEDMYLHLTKDYIAVYENIKRVWTWLDAYFQEKNNELYMLSEHRTFKDANGNKTLKPQKTEKLESCLMENCHVDFTKLNKQGFPTNKLEEKYVQGKNILFWNPVNERVARFGAGSYEAVLDCGRLPSYIGVDLGVFGVAEASAEKN